MFPYIYHVDWFDWDGDKSTLITSHGMVFADNFPEASKRVMEYFGEENVAKVALSGIGDGSHYILELTEEQAKYCETEFA